MEKLIEMNIKNKQDKVEEPMDGKVGVTAVDGMVQERLMPWARVDPKEAAGTAEAHITPISAPRARAKVEEREMQKERVVESRKVKEANKVKAEAKDPKEDVGNVVALTTHPIARKGKRRARASPPTR